MNSIAAFQMVQALDEERLRRAEKRRLASQRHAPTTRAGCDDRVGQLALHPSLPTLLGGRIQELSRPPDR